MKELLKVSFESLMVDVNVKKKKELTLTLTAVQICKYPTWIICYKITVFTPDCSDIT